MPTASAVVYAAARAWALALPFAAIPPLIAIGGVALGDEKVVLLVVLAAWVTQGRQALPTASEWRALLPSLVLVLVALTSARLAPDGADEATSFVTRLLAAGFSLLLVLRVAPDAERARRLLWTIVIGGGASALLGLGEALGWAPLQPLLAVFKVAPTRVGGELRVSASFQYATIAAMYFEMVAPLALVLAATARRRSQQALAGAIALACTADVVLSLSRAGIVTLALVYGALLVAAATRKAWRNLLVPTCAPAALLLGGVALLSARDQIFDLRLVSESDADWYGAAYSAPQQLSVESDRVVVVPVEARNEGRITWTNTEPHPFALGYRWLTADGQGVLDLAPAEVPLPHDVEPGQTIRLDAHIAVPNLPAGSYRLDWGMLQRDVLEFYERGWADAETQVQIQSGSAATPIMPRVEPRDDGEAPWVVGRLDLWGAALRIFAAHPVLGAGPDNFRHLYGAELGLEAWDERVQANNVYLDVLADLGVIGLAAFVWVIAAAIKRVVQSLNGYLSLGIGLSIAAYLVHGMLDSFLTFTPTLVLLWMLLGFAPVQKPQVSGR